MSQVNHISRKIVFVLALCALSVTAIAQEDCANGIDDDNDGLIDLNDPDCTCYTVAYDTLFGDFEDMSCCPETWSGPFGDGIECLSGWSSANAASPDYLHQCDYIGGDVFPTVPLPLPSGQGAVGFATLDTLDLWSEFIGICLPSTMLAGQTYTVEMYVGFKAEGIISSSSPFEIAIFGTSTCANYPASTAGCVEALAEWDELTTQSVSGADDSWTFTSFTFTPTQDIAAIAIGGACVILNGIIEYHFVDDIKIIGSYGGDGIDVDDIVLSGDCISGVEVTIAEIAGASYQWYLNGVAIAGATSSTYNVPAGGDGEYIVVIDNGSVCGTSEPIDVTVVTNVLNVMGTVTDVDCFGSATGSVDLDPPGDNPPIVYQWGTGQVTEDISNLQPGVYSVTVTDANGCSGVETFFVSQPDDVLMVQLINVVQPVGAGSVGSAEVSTMGGTPNYTYMWDNGETTEAATLDPGIHFVTITDANGCEEILQITINESLILTGTAIPVTCFNECDGSIELEVVGGLPNYIYNWDDGSVNPINADLCTGTYVVTVTDNAGTLIVENFEVTTPTEIIVLGNVTDMVCAESTGSIGITASGGTPGYSYIWSNGETADSIIDLSLDEYSVTVTDANGCTQTEIFFIDFLDPINIVGTVTQESCGGGGDGAIDISIEFGIAPFTYMWSNGLDVEDLDGLISGIYDITVTDDFGCTAVESFVVSQGGSLNVSVLSTDASCLGLSDGTFSVTVSGGTPPYIFTWDNGMTTPDLTGLPAGEYMLTIEDNGGCTWVDIFTIGVGAGVEIVETVTNTSCWGGNDGAIDLVVTNGTLPYSYIWSNGGMTEDLSNLTSGGYTVSITDAAGCMAEKSISISSPEEMNLMGNTISTSCGGIADGEVNASTTGGIGPYDYLWSTGDVTPSISGLTDGQYGLTVTDANGCTADTTFIIDALDAMQITDLITPASCNGGSDGAIDITISGGMPPYQFLWSNGAVTEDIQNLSANIYTLTITDFNGCMQIPQFQVSGSGSLIVVETITEISCFGDQNGEITLAVSGGIAPYIFQWSNGMSTADIISLAPGNYSVTISDAADCEFQSDYTIASVEELTYLFDRESVTCNGGMDGFIRVIAAGGTGPFDYQWSNGQNNDTIQNLSAGDYTLTITDANGCTVENQFNIPEPAPIIISIISLTNPTMVGEFGSAQIDVSGSTAPYDIMWENGESGNIATQLEVGFTIVTVTDAIGCIASIVVEIKIESFTVNFSVQNVNCFGMCSGSITLEISGGIPPYTMTWSDGQSGMTASNLCAGTYSVDVIDDNGTLVQITSVEINSPTELDLDSSFSGTTCIENNDGQATVISSGGTPPYSYQWNTGSTQSSLTNLTPGIYFVTVTDDNICTDIIEIDIPGIDPLDVTVSTAGIDCFSPLGRIFIEGQNPNNYQYFINGQIVVPSGDTLASGLSQGIYLIDYKVNDNCIVQIDEVEIKEISDFGIEATPSATEVDQGTEIVIELNITGVIGNYTVTWTADDTYDCIQEDSAGNCLKITLTPERDQLVTVNVIDDIGCLDESTIQIMVTGNRQIYIPNVFSPNDDSVNDLFKPYSPDSGMRIKNLEIFSRWGEVLYSISNIDLIDFVGWDGTYKGQLVLPGVYVYSMAIIDSEGVETILRGDITVLR